MFWVFQNKEQICFARVVTDKATFAYLAMYSILEDQGKRIGKMVNGDHPGSSELQDQEMDVGTRDAHSL